MKLINIFFLFIAIICCNNVDAQKGRNKKSAKQSSASKNKKAKAKKTKSSSKNKVKDEEENNGGGNDEQQPSTGSRLILSQDTTKPNVVTITSAFKPTLRTAAKINFNATLPELDTTRLLLNYNIPAQNLFFTYQPVAIKPLSLSADSNFEWNNIQYVKLGGGNYSTILAETGLSFGNPNNTLFNINANFITGKGSLAFQEYTKANVKASASIATIANHELVTSVGYSLSNQYKFGINPLSVFKAEDLKQNFNCIDVDAALQNKLPNNFGLTYKPKLAFNYFFDNNKASEINVVFDAAITKKINDKISFTITPKADITSYKKDSITISNNLFSLAPNLTFSNKDLTINAGFNPTWNNSEFNFLPNITGEYKILDQLTITGGWKSNFQKNNYRNLTTINPFIEQPIGFLNTKINEQFVGVKGSVGKHFSYNGQLSFLQINNQALFVNDQSILKSQNFNILYEPTLNSLRIAAEIAYTDKEKFTWLSSINFTQFTSQDSFPKAYGFIPLQVTSSAKYKILKDLFAKADLFFADGNYFRVQTIQSSKTNAIIDMNLGVEFKAFKKFNLFLDINNLFNNQYQRWNQYSALGLNIVAGFVYSFK